MIYLFSGCQAICALPGNLCSLCGQLCKQINCQPIKECCDEASKQCTHFTEKPLSSFVIVALVMSGLELYFCFGALQARGTPACRLPSSASVDLSMWLYLQMAFAIMNILFAPFFQYQVWKQILIDVREKGYALTGPQQRLDKTVVQGAFKTVFLNDLAVLFYFFAMLGYFVWSWIGGDWILHGSAECNENGLAGWSYYMGLCFFWVVFFYSVCWYCTTCCASSVRLSAPIDVYSSVPQVAGVPDHK